MNCFQSIGLSFHFVSRKHSQNVKKQCKNESCFLNVCLSFDRIMKKHAENIKKHFKNVMLF